MTNAPLAGWYDDPELAGRLRYWDGSQWTEHIAAPQPVAPQPAAPTYLVPPPLPVQYARPVRRQRTVEKTLSTGERLQAAAIDTGLLIPFVAVGFLLGPVLGWVSGNSTATGHAYSDAAFVLAVVIGGCLAFWNLVLRDTTVGTDVVAERKNAQQGP